MRSCNSGEEEFDQARDYSFDASNDQYSSFQAICNAD